MKNKIYQGSSKVLYQSEEEFALIMGFTDNIKLENGENIHISGKGVINNNISAFLMNRLDMVGIENHLIEKLNMREQLIQLVDIFPVQLYVSIIACGRYIHEFGIEEGYVFDSPIIDFRVKNSDLKNPVINEHQIISFGWLSKKEIDQLKNKAIRVFDFLIGLFAGAGMRLVEGKFEFGQVFNGEDFALMLADEISPDNCRIWDINSNEKLSFELIEQNPDKVMEAYQTILKRLSISSNDF